MPSAAATAALPHATEGQISFFIAKLCTGAGVLAIPHAFQECGIILASCLVLACVVLNSISCHILIRCKLLMKMLHPHLLWPEYEEDSSTGELRAPEVSTELDGTESAVPRRDTFAQMAYATLGTSGPQIVDVTLCITLLFAAVLYQTSLATLLESLWPPPGQHAYVALGALFLIPFVFIRDIACLGGVSAIGILAYAVSFVLIFIAGSQHHSFQLHERQWMPAQGHDQLGKLGPRLASAFGVLSFSLGVPILTFQLAESMRHQAKFLRVLDCTLVGIAAGYLIVGILGVGWYGHQAPDAKEGVQPMLLNNLPASMLTGKIARGFVCVVLLLTSPLTLVPALEILEALLFRRNQPVLVIATVDETTPLIAAPCPHARAASSMLSSSSPEELKTSEEFEPTLRSRIMENLSPTPPPTLFVGVHSLSRTGTSSVDAVVVPPPPGPSLRRSVLRVMVLVLVECCAVMLPCFTLLMSLIGCLTLNIFCFVLPPIFMLILSAQAHRKEQEQQRASTAPPLTPARLPDPLVAPAASSSPACDWPGVIGCYALLLFGLLSMVVGTAVVIKQGHCE